MVPPCRLAAKPLARAIRVLERFFDGRNLAGASTPTAAEYERGVPLRLQTSHGVLHVLGWDLPSAIDAAKLIRGRQWWVIDRAPVAVASPSDLVALKCATGRRGDAAEAAQLLAL